MKRLVGEDYFRQAARGYQRLNPSRMRRSCCMSGGQFPAYLAQRHGADSTDILRTWRASNGCARRRCWPPSIRPLSWTGCAASRPRRTAACASRLHPAVRLFESPYPALRIWEANSAPEGEPPVIDLAVGGERLALARIGMQLAFQAVNRGEYVFLEAVGHGTPLGTAIELAEASDAAFDAGAALQRFVILGLIVDFTAHPA